MRQLSIVVYLPMNVSQCKWKAKYLLTSKPAAKQQCIVSIQLLWAELRSASSNSMVWLIHRLSYTISTDVTIKVARRFNESYKKSKPKLTQKRQLNVDFSDYWLLFLEIYKVFLSLYRVRQEKVYKFGELFWKT